MIKVVCVKMVASSSLSGTHVRSDPTVLGHPREEERPCSDIGSSKGCTGRCTRDTHSGTCEPSSCDNLGSEESPKEDACEWDGLFEDAA